MNSTLNINNIAKCLLKKKGQVAHLTMLPNNRTLEDAPSDAKKASVILLLYLKNSELHTVFIQRPVYNGAHSGQVSFPGGMFECDDTSLKSTAIRETFEEIGVKIEVKEIIGSLSPLYISISKIKVYPFVAFVEPCCNFFTNADEVVHIIETPLSVFFKKETKQIGEIEVRDNLIEVPYYAINGKKIWGATAMILAEFLDCIKNQSCDFEKED